MKLIDNAILLAGVKLQDTFTKGLYNIAVNYSINYSELYDKITKGNEALVALFVNYPIVLKNISKKLNENVVQFNLTSDKSGADGYFTTDSNKYIMTEIKTTTGQIIPYSNRHRRGSRTTQNVYYKSAFKYHYNDKTGDSINEEISKYNDNKQVTIFAGLCNVGGSITVADLFFANTLQSIDCIQNANHNKVGDMTQLPVTAMLPNGGLSNYVEYIYTNPNI